MNEIINSLETRRFKGDFSDHRKKKIATIETCPSCYGNSALIQNCPLCSGKGTIKKREYDYTKVGGSYSKYVDALKDSIGKNA